MLGTKNEGDTGLSIGPFANNTLTQLELCHGSRKVKKAVGTILNL